MTSTHSTWKRLQSWPLGTGPWAFTKVVLHKAPYFRSVRPRIAEVKPGFSVVEAKNRRAVHNHLGTFHAIASCNIAELAAGMLCEATVPATHRWIPSGMNVEYLAGTTKDVRAVAALPAIPEFGDEPFTMDVPVQIVDSGRKTIVRATIAMHVSPKPSLASDDRKLDRL